MASGSSSQNLVGSSPTPGTQKPSGRWRQLLPFTHHDARATITCTDYLGKSKTHGLEQRYVSPTTGVCRRLIVQSVSPKGPHERRITDHNEHVSKLALWLLSTNPFRRHWFLKWTWIWFSFTSKLFLSFIWLVTQLVLQLFGIYMPDEEDDGSDAYNQGTYKSYQRDFSGQLWEARSKMEYSTRIKDEEQREKNIVTRSLYPRLLMILDTARNEWKPCTDPTIIRNTRYLALSYRASDVYTPGPNAQKQKDVFTQEVRLATIAQHYDAYWCDVDCIGETPDEKNLDVYCMADVYRVAEATLIMLGNSKEGERAAWQRWGARVWTLPEALLSQRLLYKFRDRDEITPITLHQLANAAYVGGSSEQVVINAYSGKDPLERLERLSLLKSVIWDREIYVPDAPVPLHLPTALDSVNEKIPPRAGSHAAERVYALMGFFGHRIQPNYGESELRALARLSMANDSDRIAERMVSMLPREAHQEACWYADDDIYGANLWDIIPEIQVAGITENGALVLDGCRAAAIRWKDFPLLSFDTSDSLRRTVFGYVPYLAWPTFIIGIAVLATGISSAGGIVLIVIGAVLLLASPKLFVFSQAGRVLDAQPWFIGVKGVLDRDTVANHLYGGGNSGHFLRMDYTPSGSEFAIPDRGTERGGSEEQYNRAKAEEARGVQMFTLVDTYAASVYYFRGERPPTVCLFTGREGGLGRFVLCSERCGINELHKETVLRMPTEVNQKMDMCGWIALG